MQTDQSEIDRDDEWYLLTYQYVARTVHAGEVASRLRHHTAHGRDEGHKSHAAFDPAWDGKAYPAVTAAIGEPMPKPHES